MRPSSPATYPENEGARMLSVGVVTFNTGLNRAKQAVNLSEEQCLPTHGRRSFPPIPFSLERVDGDSETDAGRASRGRVDRRVHPDDAANAV